MLKEWAACLLVVRLQEWVRKNLTLSTVSAQLVESIHYEEALKVKHIYVILMAVCVSSLALMCRTLK